MPSPPLMATAAHTTEPLPGARRPGDLSELRRHVNLTRELAITQFKLKYTGSVLGYVWSLFKPLMYFGVMYVVFIHLLGAGNSPHFPIQMLLGIVLYTFFAETTSTAISSVAGNGHMIRKAYFPRVIPVFASTLTAFMTFLINVTLVVVIGAAIGQMDLGWRSLLAPLLVVELYLLVIGISLLLSSLFVFYRDLGHVWEVLLQMLFYGSAVLFPLSLLANHPTLSKIIEVNPLTQVIEDFRRLVVADSPILPYDVQALGLAFAWIPFTIIALTLVVGTMVFRRLTPRFAEAL
jgi:ABC-2 type transport system permease protein